MMLVRHAMAMSPVTASPDMNAGDAAGLMAANTSGSSPSPTAIGSSGS